MFEYKFLADILNLKHELTQKTILAFWIPLAATWLMMSLEGPYLSALIARLAEPKFNLAAYGIAFSLALIIEAPVIMMMSASTAVSYTHLRAHETVLDLVCRLLLDKKKNAHYNSR